MKASLVMALSSVGIMLLTMLLSYFDQRLLPEQMYMRHATTGFPGIANGALLGNLVLMSGVLFCIGSYWNQWSHTDIKAALIIGAALSFYAFLFVYRRGLHDDAWAGAGEIHPAGIVAMIYTAGLIAAFILFYVFSDVEHGDVWMIAILLALYLPLANHIVLNFLNEQYYFSWCPRIFEEARPLLIFFWGELFVGGLTMLKLWYPKTWL